MLDGDWSMVGWLTLHTHCGRATLWCCGNLEHIGRILVKSLWARETKRISFLLLLSPWLLSMLLSPPASFSMAIARATKSRWDSGKNFQASPSKGRPATYMQHTQALGLNFQAQVVCTCSPAPWVLTIAKSKLTQPASEKQSLLHLIQGPRKPFRSEETIRQSSNPESCSSCCRKELCGLWRTSHLLIGNSATSNRLCYA